MSSTTPATAVEDKSAYFNDKKRKTDFILVVKTNMDPEKENYRMFQTYLKNLKSAGLQTEEQPAEVLKNLLCIRIHAPNPILDKAVEQYKIDVSCDNLNYRKEKLITPFGIKLFQNSLMTMKPEDPLYARAPKIFSNDKPADYTNAERILLVEKILAEVPFSEADEDKGYKMLIEKGGIKTAYPLHDSISKWSWDPAAPLTDRQILARYWANPLRFYQQQPLNLIEKYYGSEVAFYFVWVGFYTKMLVPAACCHFKSYLYDCCGIYLPVSKGNTHDYEAVDSLDVFGINVN